MHALLLTLMTYNVNYGNPSPRTSLAAIARANVDVVLLQEITTEWRALLEVRFKDAYAHRAYHVGGSGGIAILSKRPILREELLFARGTGAFFPAQRIVIDGPSGPLQLLNVHLRPAKEGGSWLRGFFSTRVIREREIATHWKQLDAALPTIVAGDFNEDADGLAVAFLARQGLARAATSGPPTWHYEKVVAGMPWDLLKMDIDHVVVDGSFAVADAHVMDAGTSDHRPVVVTLRPK